MAIKRAKPKTEKDGENEQVVE